MIDWKGELFEWMPGCIGIFRHDGECLRTVALNAKMRDILGVTEEDVQTSTCKELLQICLLYTSPSPRDPKTSRMPSSA